LNNPKDDIQRLRKEYQNRSNRKEFLDLYSFFTSSYLFTIQQRERAILHVLKNHNQKSLKEMKILEIGCGGGFLLMDFVKYGASQHNIWGIDLLFDRLRNALVILPSGNIVNADGQELPFESRSFDILLQSMAFSSILNPSVRSNMAAEMIRVLKDNGVILWYDFWWNPSNRQTAGIRPREIQRLFPKCQIQKKKITLAPPIARRIVPITWQFALFLESLTIFNSHYLALITKDR